MCYQPLYSDHYAVAEDKENEGDDEEDVDDKEEEGEVDVGDGDEDMEEGVEEQVESPSASAWTIRKLKKEFRERLPKNYADKVAVCRLLLTDFLPECLHLQKKAWQWPGMSSRSTIYRYRFDILGFLKYNEEAGKLVPADYIVSLAGDLMSEDRRSFAESGIVFTDSAFLPSKIRVLDISEEVASQLLQDRRSPDTRAASARLALEVARRSNLSAGQRGDAALLAEGINCSNQYASKEIFKYFALVRVIIHSFKI